MEHKITIDMSTENLHKQDALAKLKDLVNDIDIGMLSTFCDTKEYPYTIPMSRQEVEDDGSIWFILSSESQTYKNLMKDNKLSIAFAHVGDYKFLSVNGKGNLTQDKSRIEKYWNKFVEAWFEKGKEDPTIRVLQVVPNEAHYWDNKTNKLVTFFKLASVAITGADLELGREGKLNI